MLKMTINRAPHPALAPYVEYVTGGQNDGAITTINHFVYKDIPNATSRIIFKIGPDSDEIHLWVEGPRLELKAVAANAIEIFAFTVKPGALKTLVGIPVSVLSNQVVELSQIWGEEAEILKEKIYEASHLEARIAVLEKALIRRVTDFQGIDYFAQDLALLIHRQGGYGTLKPIFLKSGYTQRQVLRKFNDWMGMGPKQYARIVRCRNLIESLNISEEQNWSGLAKSYRYFDRSHLASDFQKLLGKLPSGFIGDFKSRASFLPGQAKRNIIVYSSALETAR
jgi:AraC-like DNA-binding protein